MRDDFEHEDDDFERNVTKSIIHKNVNENTQRRIFLRRANYRFWRLNEVEGPVYIDPFLFDKSEKGTVIYPFYYTQIDWNRVYLISKTMHIKQCISPKYYFGANVLLNNLNTLSKYIMEPVQRKTFSKSV